VFELPPTTFKSDQTTLFGLLNGSATPNARYEWLNHLKRTFRVALREGMTRAKIREGEATREESNNIREVVEK
jgi:hypothetical protein